MPNHQSFEFGDSDVESRPRRSRRTQSSSTRLILILAVAGFAFVGIGAVVYLAMRPAGSKEVAANRTDHPPTELTGKNQSHATTFAVSSSDRSQPAPKKTSDRRWTADAQLELLGALEQKERRMSENQIRLGRLSEAEFQESKAAALWIKDNGIEKASQALITAARKTAPLMISHLQREAVVRSSDYRQLVRDGKVEDRYPAEKRKELFQAFCEQTGFTSEWSLGVLFDDLNVKEMDEILVVLKKVNAEGLRIASKDQRLLILRAGALDYFQKLLERGKAEH
jgi:hypothetical protein